MADRKRFRVALYARVSTTAQDSTAQIDALEAVARRRRYEVIDRFVDDGVSGARLDRPALMALGELVEAGGVDLVLVHSLDRLARTSLLELLELLRDWDRAGVALVSVRDDIDTRQAGGRQLLQMWGTVAETEWQIQSQRTAMGMASAKARGIHVGRPRSKVPMVAVEVMLERGMTHRAIAGELGVSLSTLRRRLRALQGGQKG